MSGRKNSQLLEIACFQHGHKSLSEYTVLCGVLKVGLNTYIVNEPFYPCSLTGPYLSLVSLISGFHTLFVLVSLCSYPPVT